MLVQKWHKVDVWMGCLDVKRMVKWIGKHGLGLEKIVKKNGRRSAIDSGDYEGLRSLLEL